MDNEFYIHAKKYLTEVCGYDLSSDILVLKEKYKNYVFKDTQYGTYPLTAILELIALKEKIVNGA